MKPTRVYTVVEHDVPCGKWVIVNHNGIIVWDAPTLEAALSSAAVLYVSVGVRKQVDW